MLFSTQNHYFNQKMNKFLFFSAVLALFMFSCGDSSSNAALSLMPVDSAMVKKDSIVKDTLKAEKREVVVEIPITTSPYEVIIGLILEQKLEHHLAKSGKPRSMYSQAFFDLYDVRKTDIRILKHYETVIDELIKNESLKDDFLFENLENDSLPLVK